MKFPSIPSIKVPFKASVAELWPQPLQGPQQKAPLGKGGLLPLRLRQARLLDHGCDLNGDQDMVKGPGTNRYGVCNI